MAEPFIAEIRIFPFNFAPKGWAMCQGQILPINQNQALFSLLGTTYGGNGTTTFALPNLTNNVMIGFSVNYALGATGGEMTHTLNGAEMAIHGHGIAVSNQAGTATNPANNFYGIGGAATLYTTVGAEVSAVVLTANQGGPQPHNNMQPSLALNICMALQGIFPSRN